MKPVLATILSLVCLLALGGGPFCVQEAMAEPPAPMPVQNGHGCCPLPESAPVQPQAPMPCCGDTSADCFCSADVPGLPDKASVVLDSIQPGPRDLPAVCLVSTPVSAADPGGDAIFQFSAPLPDATRYIRSVILLI